MTSCTTTRRISSRSRLSVAALAGVLFLHSAAAPAQDRPSAIQEISAELHQGHYDEALAQSRRALAGHPQDCRLLSLQAIAYMGLHQQQSARGSFRHALAACPTYLPALEGAAQIEFTDKTTAAVPLLNRILILQPGNLAAQAMLATSLAGSNQCASALPHYQAAEHLFESQPALAQGYATCLIRTGNRTVALQQLQSLAAAQPTDENRYNVALLQWNMHAGHDATATLQPVLDNGQFEPAFNLAARIAENDSDTPRAVQLLRQAIALAPDDVENYLDFATIAFNHNSFQVGVDMLNAGLKRIPSSARLYLARGVLEAQISRQDAAVKDFEEAHRLDPKLSLSADALGIVQTQQHTPAGSLAYLREQAERSPKDPILQYLLAEQLAHGDGQSSPDLEGAIQAAKRAATLDPAYQPAHDLLANLYVRAHQPALAIQQAEVALAQNPDDEAALYEELMACRSSSDRSRVESLTRRLQEVRKNNAEKQQANDRYRLVEPENQ